MLEPKYKAVIKKGKKLTSDIQDVLTIDFTIGRVQVARGFLTSLRDVELLPYTQQKDSDGKELYLGDLVKCELDGMIRVIEWHHEDSGFILREYGETVSESNHDEKRFVDALHFSDTKVTFYASSYDGTVEESKFIQYI